MKTYRGIELDIKNSNYAYHFLGHTFYFSSKYYLDKFKEGVGNYIEVETLKLYNRNKIKIKADLYFAISFYHKIEKRGSYIVDNVTNKEVTNSQEFLIYKL